MKEILIKDFIDNQTLSTLQKVLNAGMATKRLENNRWVDGWQEFTLPIEKHKIITLYDKNNQGVFKPIGIGIY